MTTEITNLPTASTVDEEFVLPNIGNLLEDSTEIQCPACHQKNMTRVAQEAVTCVQRFVAVVNFCLCCTPIRWRGRHDINHYCSKCGCYIGRKITLSWYKKAVFKMQRSDAAAENNKFQRFKVVQKEELDERKKNLLNKPKTNDQAS